MVLPFLRKSFRASTKSTVPLLIAGAAYLQAAGISQLVKAKIAPTAGLVSGPVPRRPIVADVASLGPNHATSARAILDRNPFDSSTSRPLDRPFAIIEDPSELEKISRCEDLKARIVVAGPTPDRSVVAISEGDDKPVLLGLGDAMTDRKVQLIDWNRVVLSAGASLCQIRMFDSNKPRTAKVRRGQGNSVDDTVARGLRPEIASKIKRVTPREFDVDRAVVEKVLENPIDLMKAVRLAPERENGQGVGLRLVAVPADSLLAFLGLQNGDKLLTVNGFELSDLAKALEAYARLRTADHLTLRVERRGKDVSFDYSIK